MKKVRLFDTFSGIGGFHLALEQSFWKENIELVGFSEIDKYAIQTYLKNFPGSKNFWSISELDIAALPDFDLLTGWFPCQDVSVAWKQDLSNGRTILVEYLSQILEQKQPEYFVFENVKGLLSKKFKPFFGLILERIKNAWYTVEYKILNTKEHWIPQNRERVYIVGRRWPLFDFRFPEKEELTIFLKDILEDEVEEKFYLSDETFEKLKKFESNARICEDVCSTLNTMQGWHRQPKIIERQHWNMKAQEYFWISPCIRWNTQWNQLVIWNVNPSWKWMNWNVFDIEWISPTITTNKGEWNKIITHSLYPRSSKNGRWWTGHLTKQDNTPYCLDTGNMQAVEKQNRIRKLTPIECEILQGFPKNHTEWVSNSQRYKQCGNAITVKVAKKLFDNLFK